MTIKLVLADDHHVVREGFKMVLESQDDFLVIGEASDGLEAKRLVEQLKPDVLVVDLMMPGINGLEVVRQVNKLTRVVVLSMHNDEAYVVEALRNGALGYVLKDSTKFELITAIRKAAENQHYLSEPFAKKAIEMYTKMASVEDSDPYSTLTTREREVLQLVAQGLSNNEVGLKLSISPRTVEVHRANVMRKLDLKSQADLIRFALKRGLMGLDNK